jgi:hypothetical protein
MKTSASCHSPYVVTRRPVSRRHFLQGAGVALSLPFLNCMLPAFGRAAEPASPLAPGAKPRRFFGINNNLGLLHWNFFPTGEGRDYKPSRYLEPLQPHRNDFTVFTGVAHPNVDGGHPSDVSFLTAAPHPASSSFRNTISIDQFIGERIGTQTRFPSLTLSVNTRGRSLSCTGTGVAIPPEDRASEVFKQLFLQGTPEQIEKQLRKLDTGRSILDAVAGQAKDFQVRLGTDDRERLEQYFTSVRDLENRLLVSRGWEQRPKPVVKAQAPVDPATPAQYMAKVKVMYDLVRLAFESDSTRAITLMLDSVATPVMEIPDIPINEGYHNLSHHGRSEDKLSQLTQVDLMHMKLLAGLFADLKSVTEGEERLLDRTMVMYGSNFGDANNHTTHNMPIVFGGGGFKHGQHLVFDKTYNYPLPNLFVSILQRMDIQIDKFASSTGTFKGLEMT